MRTPSGLFFLLASTFCCAQDPTPAPTTAITTYHSNTMKFDFAYPSSFKEGKSADGQQNAADADEGCVSSPLGVMDMRISFNMILFKRYDATCFDKKLIAAGLGTAAGLPLNVAAMLSDILGGFGKPDIGTGSGYQIAGRDAYAASAAVKAPKSSGVNIIYGEGSCVLSGKQIACFVFLSNDCPSLAVLSASTIKFAAADAVPMIPAKLLQVCKR